MKNGMKNRILIILSLTIVIAGSTAFLFSTSYYWDNFTKKSGGMIVEYGFPFKFLLVSKWPLSLKNFILKKLFFNLLFWFGVIFTGWQVRKMFRKKSRAKLVKWIKEKYINRN